MLTRRGGYLRITDDTATDESTQLQREGFIHLPGAFSDVEIAELRTDLDRVFDEYPPDVRRPELDDLEWNDFRYEALNRSAVAQRIVGHRRILDLVQPLLGEDCHVIANTVWRNPPGGDSVHGGGKWHLDAGPHVPRPVGIEWDDRIPYPVFAIATHVLLEPMPIESGPTGVIPRSHTSGQAPPRHRGEDVDLTWDDRSVEPLVAEAGDLVAFVSDIWHRRLPTQLGDPGRYFLQIHYGRRDIAQRIRPTADVNHLSPETIERAGDDEAAQRVVGLHPTFFYDG